MRAVAEQRAQAMEATLEQQKYDMLIKANQSFEQHEPTPADR